MKFKKKYISLINHIPISVSGRTVGLSALTFQGEMAFVGLIC